MNSWTILKIAGIISVVVLGGVIIYGISKAAVGVVNSVATFVQNSVFGFLNVLLWPMNQVLGALGLPAVTIGPNPTPSTTTTTSGTSVSPTSNGPGNNGPGGYGNTGPSTGPTKVNPNIFSFIGGSISAFVTNAANTVASAGSSLTTAFSNFFAPPTASTKPGAVAPTYQGGRGTR